VPALALVEAARASVAGDHREPRDIVPLGDLRLAVPEQGSGDALPTSRRVDVDLLDLVVMDGHEPDDAGVDGRHCRRRESRRHSLPEVVEAAMVRQRRRDMALVAIRPAAMPDLGDRLDVLRLRRAEHPRSTLCMPHRHRPA
jgi:hypothetical protein